MLVHQRTVLPQVPLDLLDDMRFDHQGRTAALAWSLCHAYREMCGADLEHSDIDRLWQILRNFWKITDDTDDIICDLADRDVECLNMIDPCSENVYDIIDGDVDNITGYEVDDEIGNDVDDVTRKKIGNKIDKDADEITCKGVDNAIDRDVDDRNAGISDCIDTECDDPDEMEGTDKGPEDIILEIVTGGENIDEPDCYGIRLDEIPRP